MQHIFHHNSSGNDAFTKGIFYSINEKHEKLLKLIKNKFFY
jgi:hypothetical protein